MNAKLIVFVITLLFGGYSFAQNNNIPQEYNIEQKEPENIAVEKEKIKRCEELLKEAEVKLKHLEGQYARLLEQEENDNISNIEALLKNEVSKSSSNTNNSPLILEIVKLRQVVSNLREVIKKAEIRIVCISAEPVTLVGEHIDYASKIEHAERKTADLYEEFWSRVEVWRENWWKERNQRIDSSRTGSKEWYEAISESIPLDDSSLEEPRRKANEQQKLLALLRKAQYDNDPVITARPPSVFDTSVVPILGPGVNEIYGGTGRVQVRGYFRKDGTYVRPHTRSYPKR